MASFAVIEGSGREQLFLGGFGRVVLDGCRVEQVAQRRARRLGAEVTSGTRWPVVVAVAPSQSADRYCGENSGGK